jgi:hypothetical protein
LDCLVAEFRARHAADQQARINALLLEAIAALASLLRRCSSASAEFASAPSSIRASSSIDIAGFSWTTRVFQTQAPPRDAKPAVGF